MAAPLALRPTAESISDGYDLSGKIAVVTGGAAGLGLETSRVLALRGAHVIIFARNMAAAEAAAVDIRTSTSNQKVEVMHMDLASLASVRQAAAAFIQRDLPIHFLILNAGVMALPERQVTVDGFERQFATNHLGHFLVGNLLVDCVVRAAPSRIISVSSMAHMRSDVRFDDPNFEIEGSYNKWAAYCHTKTANILYALELNRRLESRGVTAVSLHPGGIMTALTVHVTDEEKARFGWYDAEGKLHPMFKTVPEGAATHLYAVVAPEIVEHGGAYLDNCKVSQDQHEHSRSLEGAKRLWELSERLLNQKFEI